MPRNTERQEYRAAIIRGMADHLWDSVWTNYRFSGRRPPGVAPPLQPAKDLAKLIEAANDGRSIGVLFLETLHRDYRPTEDVAERFGADLARLALEGRSGAGSALRIPKFSVSYDPATAELSWDGGGEPTRNPSGGAIGLILLIEDEPARQADMVRLFKRIYPAAAVEVVDNAIEANATLDAQPFDLIVSDWDLADGTTGGEVLEYIRGSHPELVSRFLFASGNAAVQDAHPYWIMKGEITKASMIDAINRMPHRNPSGCRCPGHS